MLANPILACHLFPVLAASQSWNPLRMTLIGIVGLLWLVCFASLFSRDRRKKELRQMEKQKKASGFLEKRGHPRVSYPMFVLYRVLGPGESAEALRASNARNLSQSGILLEVKQDLPIGTKLELKLALSEKSRSLLIQGAVCRKERAGAGVSTMIGVAFDVSDSRDREKLSQFVEQERLREGIS